MSTRNSAVVAAVAILVASLAGCAPTSTSGTPTSSPPTASSPSATPTAAPTVEPDPADPSTWIVGEEGVGPIEIGGDFSATLASLPDTWSNDTENCAWTAWLKDESVDYGIFFVRGTESDTAPISEVSVYEGMQGAGAQGAPATAEGLGLGATRQEILAAYPDAEEGTAQIGGGTWIRLASDGDAHVFFEFQDGVQTASDVVVTTRSEPSYEVCG